MFEKNELSKYCEELRVKRIEKDISYQEISKKLKIKASYIEAIEQAQVEKFPSYAYFIGYFKAYSQLLNMGTTSDLKHFLSPVNENLKLKPQEIISTRYLVPSYSTILISVILSALIFLVSYYIFKEL